MSGPDESSDDDCGWDDEEEFSDEEENDNLYLLNMMKEVMTEEVIEHACERIKSGKHGVLKAIEQLSLIHI